MTMPFWRSTSSARGRLSPKTDRRPASPMAALERVMESLDEAPEIARNMLGPPDVMGMAVQLYSGPSLQQTPDGNSSTLPEPPEAHNDSPEEGPSTSNERISAAVDHDVGKESDIAHTRPDSNHLRIQERTICSTPGTYSCSKLTAVTMC